ncbi:hypothetical protein SCA6_001032 [Theobroma cacao]
MRSSIHSQTESIAESPLWLLIAKMLVLVFLIAIAGISLQSVPSFNHRPRFFIPRSSFPVIRAQLMKEKKPLASLKKFIENAARTRDFVGALKAAHSRTGLPGLIAEVKKGSPTRGILRDEVKKGLLWKKKVKKSTKIQNIMAIFRFLLLLLL